MGFQDYLILLESLGKQEGFVMRFEPVAKQLISEHF